MTPPARRSGRVARTVLVLIGFVVFVGVGGYFFVQRFKPQWFDREASDPVKLKELQTANLAPPPAAQTDQGWPQWRGPNRDGRAPAGPLRTDWEKDPPAALWTTPCGGGYSSPAVVGGRVYVLDRPGDQERILCLDAATGTVVWETAWEADYSGIGYGSGPRAAPTIHDGRVYAFGATGKLVCLEQSSGKNRWERDLRAEFDAPTATWGFASSPLVVDDLVVVQVGAKEASVVAVDRVSGEPRWKAGSDPNGYSSPVLATCAGVRQVIAVTGESVLGLRPESGDILWRYDWRTQFNGNIATPVVAGDYVFVSSGYAKGCTLLHLAADGSGVKAEQVYFRKARVMRNHHSSCVHKDGYLYGYDEDTLRCVDLRTGEVQDGWNAKDASGNRLAKGGVILVGDHLIGLTQTGTLFLADADPEEFRFRGKVAGVLSGQECWALPVLVDGRIYLRDGEKVVCLDARPK